MNSAAEPNNARTGAGPGLAAIWPAVLAADTDSQRRRKLAIRSAHLAVASMVLAALAGSLAAGYGQLTRLEIAALAGAALAYIAWSLLGTRDAVRRALWEGDVQSPGWPAPAPARSLAVYFVVQLALSALIYHLGDRGQATGLVWLVLLPPVAHAVLLLPRHGVVLVCAATLGILTGNVVGWHGWGRLPYALLAFSFALLFTLVFTLLATSSEKARWEVQRLASELAEANGKLRAYAVQAEELAATRERNRLAREIHDSLGHYLTVVNVHLEAARALQGRDDARARDALGKAQSLTHEGLQEIRRSVAALRASPLDNVSLPEALRKVAEESQAAGLATHLQVLGDPRALSPQAALTLYRAGQEGLTNARKHARAQAARLELDFRQPDRVRLSVADDGAGAAQPAEAAAGFGLLGLRERALLLGGEVRTRSIPGQGFTLEVEVPA